MSETKISSREIMDVVRKGDGLTLAEIADKLGVFKLSAREALAGTVRDMARIKLLALWKRDLGKRFDMVYKARS